MKLLAIVLAAMLAAGCWPQYPSAELQPIKGGTAVLLFPEWAKSESDFEQIHHTCIFAYRTNDAWLVVYDMSTNGVIDGRFTGLWDECQTRDSLEACKEQFAWNIDWKVKKVIHDELVRSMFIAVSNVMGDVHP